LFTLCVGDVTTTYNPSTNAAAAGNDSDGEEKLINLDKGCGLISKETYKKAESTVVLINNAA